MLTVKLTWLIAVVIIVQGCCCSNSTQKTIEPNTTVETTTETVTKPNLNQTTVELLKIFHGETNATEQTLTNTTLPYEEQSRNDTYSTNHTLTEAVASSDDVLPFRLPNWAAIAAGVCLVSGVIGYISCVSYRRFLQRKYGNSQVLIGEDVYDTSDLRNFEI